MSNYPMRKLSKDYTIDRYGLQARLVEEKDAQFIVDLRTNHHTRFMSTVSSDLKKQIEWIKNYKKREEEGTDYYFIFSKNGKDIGLNRIYDIRSDIFSTGSWAFTQEAPFGAAFLAQVICREIAFDELGLAYEEDPIGVHVENVNVLKYNFAVGLKDIGRVTIEKGEYVSLGLTKEDFEKGKEYTFKLTRYRK